jgi:hypothetical protein
MTSNITSFIAPALPVQIPVAYSPTDELLMMIGATLGGAAPPAPTYHVLVEEGASHKVLYHGAGDLVVSQ